MSAETLPRARCLRRAMGAVQARPDDAWWSGLPILNLRETTTGAAPQQTTDVKLAWDDADLRILFEVRDTHVWATHSERDAPLYEEEVVEVFLDPVGDLQCYFEIEVNPLNAVLDLVLRKNRSGYGKDFAWNCAGLRTAAQRTPEGWCAELAIPLGSLVAEPFAGNSWRANFFRIDRPPGAPRELSAWSPTGRATFHVAERFGILEFST